MEMAVVVKTVIHHFTWSLNREDDLLPARRHPGNLFQRPAHHARGRAILERELELCRQRLSGGRGHPRRREGGIHSFRE